MFADGKRRLVASLLGSMILLSVSGAHCAPSDRSQSSEAKKLDSSGAQSKGLLGSELENISLKIAEQYVIAARGVRSYSEGTRGIVDVRLTRDGDQFVLVGQEKGVTSLLFIMLDGSERHLEITVGDPEESLESEVSQLVKKEENIRLDFYFVQLDRSRNHQIGIGYPQSVSLGTAAANFDFMSQTFQSATAVVEDQALLRLDMAQASGWAKLKRKAAVIAENGQRAEFSGGGEVNIPVQGSLTTGIHTIEYGSRIEILPRYDSKTGRLEIALSADVSDLTDDRGSGAPGRATASISTIVNLELGQALVLAGLSSESKVKGHSGVPFLSQIPILGLLFGSERMSHQSVDNVIFIVPTVVDATSSEARAQIKKAFTAYQKYSGGPRERKILQNTWEKK